jgi:hypothetical protein
MSDFPANKYELLRANYRLSNASATCKGCGAAIEWWKTGNNKSIPMNPMDGDHARAVAHWSTCPNAKDFKGGNTAAPAEKRSMLGPSVGEEVRRLRAKHNARVVVLIDDEGTLAFWRTGIPAEDLRHDLISAGNFVRSEIAKKEGTPA